MCFRTLRNIERAEVLIADYGLHTILYLHGELEWRRCYKKVKSIQIYIFQQFARNLCMKCATIWW